MTISACGAITLEDISACVWNNKAQKSSVERKKEKENSVSKIKTWFATKSDCCSETYNI